MSDDWGDGVEAAMRRYWAGEVEFDGASESDTGGRKVKFRILRNPGEDLNPFSKATLRRGGRAGTRFQVGLVPVVGNQTLPAQGHEFMLLAWADGPRGSTATFLLSNDGDHPFMHLNRASSKTDGDRFMAAFAELAEDGTAIDESSRLRHEAASCAIQGQSLSNQAAILCKSRQFATWLFNLTGYTDVTDGMRKYLGIQSRGELDTNPEAAERFRRMRAEFNLSAR